ncbi:MAG: hypothetical protein ACREFW_02185 [Rhizomicrobium sp.]
MIPAPNFLSATLVQIAAITMAYAAARLGNLVASGRARRRIDKGAGLVMVGAAIAIMVK